MLAALLLSISVIGSSTGLGAVSSKSALTPPQWQTLTQGDQVAYSFCFCPEGFAFSSSSQLGALVDELVAHPLTLRLTLFCYLLSVLTV